jgi:hypothetical protein
MQRLPPLGHRDAGRVGRWRGASLRGLLALALVMPGAAHPIGLPQLLHMSLEQLMRLKISVPSEAPRLRHDFPGAQRVPSERGGA